MHRTRRVVGVAALCAGTWLAGCAAPARAPRITPELASPLTPEQRQLNLEAFDQVWLTIHEHYWDPTFGGVDWPAVRTELRPKMERAESMEAVLRHMVGRLGVSHFLILPADVYRGVEDAPTPEAPYGDTGIDARVIDGLALVTAVTEGSPADRAGVRPGWELLRIDEHDEPAELARLTQELHGNPKANYVFSAALFDVLVGPVDSTADLALRDGHDQIVTLTLPRTQDRGRTASFGNVGAIRVWIEVRRLEGDIGYIAFNGFFNPPYVMQTYNDALASFLNAEGLILDLRGNGGGIGAMALGMAGWLVGEPDRHLGTLATRETQLKMIIQPRAQTYAGPLAVLVDELSGSAAEFLAGGLQQLGRARVFGRRTKGEALPAQFGVLPNADIWVYALANFVLPDGRRLEGVGVVPDEEVVLTRAALLAGRDPVLDAAVTWIARQK